MVSLAFGMQTGNAFAQTLSRKKPSEAIARVAYVRSVPPIAHKVGRTA